MADSVTLRDAAHGYGEAGIRVLPVSGVRVQGAEAVCTCGHTACTKPGKHPLVINWRAVASTDPTTIERWWSQWPNANIGLICGETFDVLDIDGDEALDALLEATGNRALSLLSGELPLVQSGGGTGHLHMYFESIGVNRSSLVTPKIQVLSTGHFVIAPPSMHRSGHCYDQVSDLSCLGPAPEWLTSLLTAASAQAAPETVIGLEDFTDDHSGVRAPAHYAAGALRVAVERIARAPQGTRNNTLNAETFAVSRFIWSGDLSMGEVLTEIFRAATAAGLDEREIVATIASAVTSSHGETSSA